MLPQIRHIIVNMLSSILIVAFPKPQEIKYLAENIICSFMCDKLWKLWGFPNILAAILCFANLKVEASKKERYATDSHSAHANYVKTSEYTSIH